MNATQRGTSDRLHELTLLSELATIEIRKKNVKAEKIKRNIKEKKNKLNKVNKEIRQLKVEQETTRNVQNLPVLDRNGIKIEIDSTVEVVNVYTSSAKTFASQSRQEKRKLEEILFSATT